MIRIFDAQPGQYDVSVIGTDAGEYLLSLYSIDENGKTQLIEHKGEVKKNKQDKYSFTFVGANQTFDQDDNKGHGNDLDFCDENNPGNSPLCELLE